MTLGRLSTLTDTLEPHAKYAVDLELRHIPNSRRDVDRHASHNRTSNIDLVVDKISEGSKSGS